MRRLALASIIAAAAVAAAPAIQAKPLRWSSQGDFLTSTAS